jgi:hypothetical protein
MNIYKPTWLYIKKHNLTGLMYFGKTTSNDPTTYTGSGKYWRLHLKKHGIDITTLWCYLYCDRETLMEEALSFSRSHSIVDSNNWANLKPETGIDGGGIVGRMISKETKQKIGNANKGRKMSKEFCQMRSEKQKGKVPWNKGKKGVQVGSNKGKKFGPPSNEYRENMSKLLKGKPKPPRSKEHSENISKAKIGKSSHPQTEESKRKISLKNLGRKKMCYPGKEGTRKMVSANQVDEYLTNGWRFVKV